jgi:hypothetical protein
VSLYNSNVLFFGRVISPLPLPVRIQSIHPDPPKKQDFPIVLICTWGKKVFRGKFE